MFRAGWHTGRWHTGRWHTGRWHTGRWPLAQLRLAVPHQVPSAIHPTYLIASLRRHLGPAPAEAGRRRCKAPGLLPTRHTFSPLAAPLPPNSYMPGHQAGAGKKKKRGHTSIFSNPGPLSPRPRPASPRAGLPPSASYSAKLLSSKSVFRILDIVQIFPGQPPFLPRTEHRILSTPPKALRPTAPTRVLCLRCRSLRPTRSIKSLPR